MEGRNALGLDKSHAGLLNRFSKQEKAMHLIQNLKLKSGPSGATEPLEVQPGTVTLFVGPNHSGKSLLLREIRDAIPNARFSAVSQCLLQDIGFNPLDEETAERFRVPIRETVRETNFSGFVEVSLGGSVSNIERTELEASFSKFSTVDGLRSQFGHYGHNMANSLIKLLTGSERLGLLGNSTRGDLRQPQSSTLGILFKNDAKRSELQRLIHAAFGWYLVIDPTLPNDFRAAVAASMPPLAARQKSLG